jgi:hypothetical protein
VDFEQVAPYTTSPVKFDLQKDREPFTKYGVFGQYPCNAERFTRNKNEYSVLNTKYAKYDSPSFGKWANHSLDEYQINLTSTE